MKGVIRAPAFGTRLRKEAELRPKPIMEINRRREYMWCKGPPPLRAIYFHEQGEQAWWVLKSYSSRSA
jgi:hypothetical protein